eukprot:527674_1
MIALSFITWLCRREPKLKPRQQLCCKLLLQVLMINFIGKSIRWLILLNLLHEDQSHSGNCQLIGYLTLFADSGGLYFYSLAAMVSFSQTIPFIETKISFIIDNETYLETRIHLCIWSFTLCFSLMPFCFSDFGFVKEEQRCYVKTRWILLAFYRIWVYIFGVICGLCSIYMWCDTTCLKDIRKQKLVRDFATIVLFPFFIIMFSLPFEIKDLCGLFEIDNSHNTEWSNINVTWGHLFGAAVAVIYLCSLWQDNLVKILNVNISTSQERTSSEQQQPGESSEQQMEVFQQSNVDKSKNDNETGIELQIIAEGNVIHACNENNS